MNPRFHRIFDYDKNLLPNKFIRDKEMFVTDLDSAVRVTGKTVGYPGWNLLYYCCLCSLDPTGNHLIIETGTNFGYSTIILAQALRDSGSEGKVLTIEIEPGNYELAKENFIAAGVEDLIETHLGDSIELLPQFNNLENTSFVFLDGNHSMQHVLREFSIVETALKSGGKVFFDNTEDIGQKDDLLVYGALKTIEDTYKGNLVRFPFCSWYTPGQAIWEKA